MKYIIYCLLIFFLSIEFSSSALSARPLLSIQLEGINFIKNCSRSFLIKSTNSMFSRNLSAQRDNGEKLNNLQIKRPSQVLPRIITTHEVHASPRIYAKDLDLSFGSKQLFSNLEFSISPGQNVTIVGENGCGKSTFLRILTGDPTIPFIGTVNLQGRVGYLPQQFEEIESDVPALLSFLRILNFTEFLEAHDNFFTLEWYKELNELGAYDFFRQVELSGISKKSLEKPFRYLSGGEKTKSMLCVLHQEDPDFLLLDEPTNHLDSRGIKWLENFLKRFQGGVVMVTHDRSLINNVSHGISELSPITKQFVHFRGGYKGYLEEQSKIRLKAIQERQIQEKELKTLSQKVEKFSKVAGTKVTRSSQDRDKLGFNARGERNEKGQGRVVKQLQGKIVEVKENLTEVPPERTKIKFNFDKFKKDISLQLRVSELSKAFNDVPLFKKLTFTVMPSDRLIIQGENGCGKTTLLRIIHGSLEPDEGTVSAFPKKLIGYLDQEQETLNLNMTPIQLLQEDSQIKATNEEIRLTLTRFGVYTRHDLTTPLKDLSIGCRRKTQFCQIYLRYPSVLLLDEPTNHIDFQSLETIEESLIGFPGIIIAVTHDRYFTEKVGTQVLKLDQTSK